jgi:hypothetical protein
MSFITNRMSESTNSVNHLRPFYALHYLVVGTFIARGWLRLTPVALTPYRYIALSPYRHIALSPYSITPIALSPPAVLIRFRIQIDSRQSDLEQSIQELFV